MKKMRRRRGRQCKENIFGIERDGIDQIQEKQLVRTIPAKTSSSNKGNKQSNIPKPAYKGLDNNVENLMKEYGDTLIDR